LTPNQNATYIALRLDPTPEQLSKRDGALEQTQQLQAIYILQLQACALGRRSSCKLVRLGDDKPSEKYNIRIYDEKVAKADLGRQTGVPLANALELKDPLRKQQGIHPSPHVVLIDHWTGKTETTYELRLRAGLCPHVVLIDHWIEQDGVTTVRDVSVKSWWCLLFVLIRHSSALLLSSP
jgi:hypothetical protein